MNEEEQNYKKALLFKISIIVIVVAIFFLWLANLQNVFKNNSKSGGDDTWQKITNDVDRSLERLDKITNDATSSSTTSSQFVEKLVDRASSSVSTTSVKIELKEELSDLIKQATTTPKSNCPEYINCMPSIGEARPCVIPVGCENVTQIAY